MTGPVFKLSVGDCSTVLCHVRRQLYQLPFQTFEPPHTDSHADAPPMLTAHLRLEVVLSWVVCECRANTAMCNRFLYNGSGRRNIWVAGQPACAGMMGLMMVGVQS